MKVCLEVEMIKGERERVAQKTADLLHFPSCHIHVYMELIHVTVSKSTSHYSFFFLLVTFLPPTHLVIEGTAAETKAPALVQQANAFCS